MKADTGNAKRFEKPVRTCLAGLLGVLCLGYLGVVPALDFGAEFDHASTGYVLEYKHAIAKCETCHQDGIFAGTPRKCVQCHSNKGRIRVTTASSQHIPVTPECEFCHRPNTWYKVSKVDHFAVLGSCQSCHNGVIADGKNPGHIQSGDVCDDCHRSFSWKGAVFDHGNVSGNCISCHNGIIASGKSASHISSSNGCEDCHSTLRWSPAVRVEHSAVLGSCFVCHNGVVAEGKNPQHITSGNDCDFCHTTFAWLPATFAHQSPAFPGEHRRNLACGDCHVGNSAAVAWTNAAFQPDCAGCHAADFKSGPHKKHENPDVSYTVSELRDCSGACHVYTDSSLTTIKETRQREHQVSDSEF